MIDFIFFIENFNAYQYNSSDMAKVHFLTYETLLCETSKLKNSLILTHICSNIELLINS